MIIKKNGNSSSSSHKKTLFVDTNIIVSFLEKNSLLLSKLALTPNGEESTKYHLYYSNTVREERTNRPIRKLKFFNLSLVSDNDFLRVEIAAKEIMALTGLEVGGTNYSVGPKGSYRHTLNDIKILLESGYLFWQVADIDDNSEPVLLSNNMWTAERSTDSLEEGNMYLYKKLYLEKQDKIETIVNDHGLEHIITVKTISTL